MCTHVLPMSVSLVAALLLRDAPPSVENLHVEDTLQSRMYDHTDGPEAVAAGKKKMLDGHTGGPQGRHGRHGQHEERGVNLANVSGVATGLAPHPSAAKKPRKAPVLCKHQRQRSRCKDCGGGGLCEHQRVRSSCRDCGGSSFCEHQRQRSMCKACGGNGLCEHQRAKSKCKACGGSSICQHQHVRSTCRDCGGGSICKHQRPRSTCQECGGGCKRLVRRRQEEYTLVAKAVPTEVVVVAKAVPADAAVVNAVPASSCWVEPNVGGHQGDYRTKDDDGRLSSKDACPDATGRRSIGSKRSDSAQQNGWREYESASGRVYYNHKVSKTTQWKTPPDWKT